MVSVWGLTDKGIVRRENQDSCAYETIPERGLAWGVVCDGMGGAKAGDIASKLAVETFRTHLEDLRGPDLPGETGSCSWPLRRTPTGWSITRPPQTTPASAWGRPWWASFCRGRPWKW